MLIGVGWNELICKTGNEIQISAVSRFRMWVCSSKIPESVDLAYSAQLFSHTHPVGVLHLFHDCSHNILTQVK